MLRVPILDPTMVGHNGIHSALRISGTVRWGRDSSRGTGAPTTPLNPGTPTGTPTQPQQQQSGGGLGSIIGDVLGPIGGVLGALGL